MTKGAAVEVVGELGAAWERALAATATDGVRLWRAPAEAPVGRDAVRTLSERLRPRGWDEERIVRALREPAWAALARLLAGRSAGLIVAGDGEEVVRWLEPERAGAAIARLRLGRRGGETAPSFAWAEGAEATAAELSAAADWLAAAWARPVTAVVASFTGAASPRRGAWEEVLRGLRARAEAAARPGPRPEWLELYSPLFYPEGRLDADGLLAAIAHRAGAALPLIWAPRLAAHELAAALAGGGGAVSAVLLIGAERPAAVAAAGADAAAIELTLAGFRAALAAA